jgi:hypothetical protein
VFERKIRGVHCFGWTYGSSHSLRGVYAPPQVLLSVLLGVLLSVLWSVLWSVPLSVLLAAQGFYATALEAALARQAWLKENNMDEGRPLVPMPDKAEAINTIVRKVKRAAIPSLHHTHCTTLTASHSLHHTHCTTLTAPHSLHHTQCITLIASHSLCHALQFHSLNCRGWMHSLRMPERELSVTHNKTSHVSASILLARVAPPPMLTDVHV